MRRETPVEFLQQFGLQHLNAIDLCMDFKGYWYLDENWEEIAKDFCEKLNKEWPLESKDHFTLTTRESDRTMLAFTTDRGGRSSKRDQEQSQAESHFGIRRLKIYSKTA